MGRKKLPFFEKITITDVGAEGKAIARINDVVTFVSMAAPGDIVDLQVTKICTRFMEAKVTGIHKRSEKREIPVCKHFGICGGCRWQHLTYPDQLKYKEKQVADTLKRIGKLDIPKLLPIIGSREQYFYRNKLEFAFSSKRWFTKEEIETNQEFKEMNGVGFHIPGHFDRVVDIQKCWLQADPSNEIRNEIRKYSFEKGLSFFNPKDNDGFLRNLIIRTSSIDGVMVILIFFREDRETREPLLEHIRKKFPEISSLMYSINNKPNETLYNQDILVFSGKDHLMEIMGDLKFKIGPKSFFQTNTNQAYELYRTVENFAGLSGNEIVYDLYAGTGTITIFIARRVKKVIGIESVPEAISDAKINCEINKIKNTVFHTGDMKELLTDTFFAEQGKPDIIITDPPRAGMHPKVVEHILKALPEKIVYVSCNPATQARDLELLSARYKIKKSQPIDMFPQTHHVENVALMVRNQEPYSI